MSDPNMSTIPETPRTGASRGKQPIHLEMHREYNRVRPHPSQPGKLSDIIDFHTGKDTTRNRYMRINQPTQTRPRNPLDTRFNQTRFRNPILNKYDDDGNEEYERKYYVFEFQDEDEVDKKKKLANARKKTVRLKTLKESYHSDDEDGNGGGAKGKKKDSARKVDEKKVDNAVKMIEDVLKDKKKKKKDPNELSEQEKQKKYLEDKKIAMNASTNNTEDVSNLAKKPAKKNVTNEIHKNTSTQTPRDDDDVKFEDSKLKRRQSELDKDPLQFASSGKAYVKILVDDAQKIGDDVNARNGSKSAGNGRKKSLNGLDPNKKTMNSLGMNVGSKNGIDMAIIKGIPDETNKNGTGEKSEQILLKRNYQNLEELIEHLSREDIDANYLKIAKLNRLKVLMELAMRMVGRKYKDIGNNERNTLELEANRYHTTYPMPGEEKPLEVTDADGRKRIRMPIVIKEDKGAAKIDINNRYLIDPSDFLTIYTTKLIDHAQLSTGLKFDNITVTIPAAYGTQQREAIKHSINKAASRDDIKILTRPVAAAVILNNQRNAELPNGRRNSLSLNQPEAFKLVFDMTEDSMDASVIRIKESKDFQVMSNVGDTSFGLHDIDERIVEHIINNKTAREKKSGRKFADASSVETVNAYSNLVRHIKEQIVENGAVNVDLANMHDDETKRRRGSKGDNDLLMDKNLIANVLCKDIYEWSLAHIDKAIMQADVDDKDIDEIILIGDPSKMPGFLEYVHQAFPHKRINFVREDDLAVGAAIVGRKLKYQQIKVTEILCRSIGIGLYTGVITYLLFRNSSLPCVGGCIYSTLIDDQESMVLDVYEGERPHVKFGRYLGEVTVHDLPPGIAGKVKCELHLTMNSEGILEVTATDVGSGKQLETIIDANPEKLGEPDEVNNDTELDPIEAERYRESDYNLVYQLELLDDNLEFLSDHYREHRYANLILDKLFDTKEWLFKNRRTITIDECKTIQTSVESFLRSIEKMS